MGSFGEWMAHGRRHAHRGWTLASPSQTHKAGEVGNPLAARGACSYGSAMTGVTATVREREQRLLTAEEFLDWLQPGVHGHLVQGEIVMHSPVNLRHADLLNFLDPLLRAYIERRQLGRLYREVVAVRLGPREGVFLPDLAFFTTGSRRFGSCQLTRRSRRGWWSRPCLRGLPILIPARSSSPMRPTPSRNTGSSTPSIWHTGLPPGRRDVGTFRRTRTDHPVAGHRGVLGQARLVESRQTAACAGLPRGAWRCLTPPSPAAIHGENCCVSGFEHCR